MVDLAAARTARQAAVGGNTLDDKTKAWNWYTEYCNSIGLGDNPFPEGMSQTHKIKILGGFDVAVRQGQFSRPLHAPLAEITVADSLKHVAVTFRDMNTMTPSGTPSATLHDFYGGN